MSIDVSGIEQGQRNDVGFGGLPRDRLRWITEVADVLVEQVGTVRPGQELLDVATGSGNAAIAAARCGRPARRGLDLDTRSCSRWPPRRATEEGRASTSQLHRGRCRTRRSALRRRLSSTASTSCFGVMFAPLRHEVAADELVGVARPGAGILVAGVDAGGPQRQDVQRDESARTGCRFTRLKPPRHVGGRGPCTRTVPGQHQRRGCHSSGCHRDLQARLHPDAWVEYNEQVLGPSIMAKAALEPQGRYEQLRAELIGLYSEANEALDGTLSAQAEYLVTLIRLPG